MNASHRNDHSSDDDDVISPRGSTCVPTPHPQRAQVDLEKLRARNAMAFHESQSSVPRDRPHARAVIKGIFGEAVRTARTREGFEEAPWREAMAAALSDFDEALTQQPGDTTVQSVMMKIQSKISAMDLFSHSRVICGQFGVVHDGLQGIIKRQRQLLANLKKS